MGIYKLHNSKTWHPWSSEELRILRENKKFKTIEDLRKMIPYRTWHSISCKAYELGISRKPADVNVLYDFQKGWLAALIDGEGTITLHRTRLKSGQTGYHPRLMIGNTNKELIEKANEIIGAGHISKIKSKNKLKPMWAYELSTIPLGKLLPQITDYLIVKKRQAKITAEVIKINETFHGGKRKYMTSQDFKKLSILNEEIVTLNKRTNFN